jgi:hypothetical protein
MYNQFELLIYGYELCRKAAKYYLEVDKNIKDDENNYRYIPKGIDCSDKSEFNKRMNGENQENTEQINE